MLTLGLILVSLAAPVPAKPPRRPAPPPPLPQCVALQVTSPQAETDRTDFSAGEVLDLRISTSFRRLTGPHRLELRVYTPQGFLYQRFAVPFDASSPPSDGDGRRPPRRSVGVRLPVAGTAITTNSLYGRWKVVPFLDGEANACGRERTFVIEQ